jgi:hypothetical protein
VRLAFFEYPMHYRASNRKAEMQTKYIVRLVFGLAVLILGNGCVTKHLWESSELEDWNQPAANSNLRVYQAEPKKDVLVIYDEYCERSDATRTRAYWLNENQKLISDRAMPHFVSTNSASGLTAVPVLLATTDQTQLPPLPYAIVETNGSSFTIHADGGTLGSHDLPVYNDRKGKVEKFVLTPLATTADLTIVGGFVGYLYLAWRCGANGPIY